MDDQILFRMRRLYHAVKSTMEMELQKFPARTYVGTRSRIVLQDFSGDMPYEEMANSANTAIGLVAGLEDHLRRWARSNGRSPERVTWTFENSEPLRLVHDLSNREKHGGPPRDGKGRSGRAPELGRIRRMMRLATRAEKGSTCCVRLARDGTPTASGDGTAYVAVTADILDSHNSTIGDLHETLTKAIAACEQLCTDLGMPLPKSPC